MSQASTSAPAPSQHVFLHELAKLASGTKVRFLCCVVEYETATGQLYVEHSYPRHAKPIPRAVVDVNIVLENTDHLLLRPGNWLNIIGYVQKTSSLGSKRKRPRQTLEGNMTTQAILVWGAGTVGVSEYEAALTQQRTARDGTAAASAV